MEDFGFPAGDTTTEVLTNPNHPSGAQWASCADGVLNMGDTAWMLTSIGLVFLQTPAIGITQAGMIRRKNSLSMLMQAVAGMAIGGLLWAIVGYSLVFGASNYVIGGFEHTLLFQIPAQDCLDGQSVPAYVFVAYQCMFALMVPVILTGAWAEKLTFKAFVIFAVLWPLLVYYPIAHMIWGGGWIANWGVLDYAGGLTIHTTSGVASLIVSLMLTKREHDEDEYQEVHHNVALTVIGGTMIWFGWFGFNGGSDFRASHVAAFALLNTHLAASVSGVTWMVISYFRSQHFHLGEILNGAFAGLAGVTPAAGFVHPQWAMVIGLMVGIGSYTTSWYLSDKLLVDDVLDVTSLQGTPGLIGSIFGVGLFASAAINHEVGISGAVYRSECYAWGDCVGDPVCFGVVDTFVDLSAEALETNPKGLLWMNEDGESAKDLCEAQTYETTVVTVDADGVESSATETVSCTFQWDQGYGSETCNGNTLFLRQLVAGIFVVGWTVVFTWITMKIVLWLSPELTEEEYQQGLDVVDHGAKAMNKEEAIEKLIKAAAKGDLAEVKKAVRMGSNPNIGDYDGRTAYHLAAAEGHLHILQYLASTPGPNFNAVDRMGGTPLTDAITHKQDACAAFLRDNGATVSEDPAKMKQLITAFNEAASSGDIDEMKRLMDAGVPISGGDYDGRTALHLAASEGQFPAVKFLTKNGANPNATDRFGNTPFDDAEGHNHKEVANFLSEANMNTAKTLCHAASENDIDTMKRIAKGGVNINVGDYDKRTALHLAAASGNFEAVEFLLGVGADASLRDRWNHTAADDAQDHPEVLALLRKATKDVIIELQPVKRQPLNYGPVKDKYLKKKQ